MEVIGHDNKFMQQVFVSLAVVKKDLNEQLCHSFRLEYVSLLKCRGCDEIATVSGVPATGSSHEAPQRLKSRHAPSNFIAAPEALRHPKAEYVGSCANSVRAGFRSFLRIPKNTSL
jgi:hypothetical protein